MTLLTLEDTAGTVICNHVQCIICKRISSIVQNCMSSAPNPLPTKPGRNSRRRVGGFSWCEEMELRTYNCGTCLKLFCKGYIVRNYSSHSPQCLLESTGAPRRGLTYSSSFPSVAAGSLFARRWQVLSSPTASSVLCRMHGEHLLV